MEHLNSLVHCIKWPTAILIIFLSFSLSAQCVDFDDLNSWIDASELLEEEFGLVGDQPVLLPENWTSLFRPFSLGLSILDELPEDSFELANNFLGLKQLPVNNSTTDFAMCLTPDEFLNVSDALSFFFCEEEPNSITINLSHMGLETDSLQIVYIQRQGDVVDDLIQGIDDPASSGITAYGAGVLAGGISTYRDIQLNIERFPSSPDDPNVPDTAVIWMIAKSDAEDLTTNLSYCINSVEFNYAATSTSDLAQTNLTLSPNPADQFLQVELEDPDLYDISVFDISGKLRYSGQMHGLHEIYVANWPDGLYSLHLRNSQGVIARKFVKY